MKKLPPPIPFSKEGYQKLQTLLESLNIQRQQVLTRLQLAREQGDLSENGAYKAARFELGNIDRQLRQTRRLLHFGRVITVSPKPNIDFGATITLQTTQSTSTYTLVGSYESNPQLSKISINSPLGAALLGKKTGDSVTVQTPSQTTTYHILSFHY